MSEREKMLAGQLYNHYDKQLTTERKEIAEKVFTYNGTRELDKQQELLPTMLGKVGNNVEIKIPFMCDYGYNIEIGDNEHDGVAAVVEKFIWEQAFALIA